MLIKERFIGVKFIDWPRYSQNPLVIVTSLEGPVNKRESYADVVIKQHGMQIRRPEKKIPFQKTNKKHNRGKKQSYSSKESK